MNHPLWAEDAVASPLAREERFTSAALREMRWTTEAMRQANWATVALDMGGLSESVRKALTPLAETTTMLQRVSKEWSDQWAKAMEPTRRISELMAKSQLGQLADIQRSIGLTSRSLLESITNAMQPVLAEQQRWKALHADLGMLKVSESILAATRQWGDLARFAGIEPHAYQETMQSVVALHQGLASLPLADEWYDDQADGGEEQGKTTAPPPPPTLDDIQAVFQEVLEVRLPPLLAGLRSCPTPKARFYLGLMILLVLERLLSFTGNLASIDGWRMARFGSDGQQTLQLSPTDLGRLRDSMDAVLAVGQFLSAQNRLVTRSACLYRAPNKGRLNQRIPPRTHVKVLEERHEWIAVSFEDGDEWISGWVMKKYTERIPPTSSAITK